MRTQTITQPLQMNQFPFYSLLVITVNCPLVTAAMYFKLFYGNEGKRTNGVEKRERGERVQQAKMLCNAVGRLYKR